MQPTTFCNRHPLAHARRTALQIARFQKTFRLTTLLLLFVCLQASATSYSQLVTISAKNTAFKKVTDAIEAQTNVQFIWHEDLLAVAKPVTIELNKVPLEDALAQLFKGQDLGYTIKDQYVIVKNKDVGALDNKPLNVTGKVMNEREEPLPGISVLVKGTKRVAFTDDKGEFVIKAIDDNATLVISGVSHEAQEVKLKGREAVKIVLREKVKDLDETVVVAYGKTTQRANTGAVTVVKGEQIQNLPNRSFDKSLQGLVPGLLVTSGSGQPGSAPSNFVLRGIATGAQPVNGETFRNPLIIIDGIPVSQEPAAYNGSGSGGDFLRTTNPLAQINPSDIESVSVLKDASAIALYGSKASNGVLIVTTKRGKTGKTVFGFRHQTDLSSTLNGKIQVLNQQEYLELIYEAYKNSDPTVWTDATILNDLKSKFPTRSDGSFYPQSDWLGALMNSHSLTTSNELSMSGGSEKSNFYLNLEYTKQNGTTKNTGYDRKSIRFNYEHRPELWLKLGINTMLSYNVQKYSNETSNNFLKTVSISPLNPIRDTTGQYIYGYQYGQLSSGYLSPNPVAQSELNINTSTAYRGLTKLYTEVAFTRNFNFSSSLGVDFMMNEVRIKNHPLVFYGIGSISNQPFRTSGLINTNIFRFNKELNKVHSIDVLVGQEAQIATTRYIVITRYDISYNPNQTELQEGVLGDATGNSSKQTQVSYFSQINYGFRSKYYLSGSIRTDGSSRFGKNNRFGSYWSLGGSWITSSEPFMKRTGKWLNLLKFRGSMGPAGNSAAISDALRFDGLSRRTFFNGPAVYIGGGGNPGNPSIKWEQTFTWDAGAELRLMKDRIGITVDIYNRKTTNLIAYDINAALATGFDYFTGNVGDLKNHGVEISFQANVIRNKFFKWSITANWARNQNKLTKSFLPSKTVAGTNLVNEVGHEYNSFFLKRWAGVNPANGRPMWIDSTGKASENYNSAKQEIAGKAQPDGFGSISNSINYKGIELSAVMYYQYGSQIYFNSILQNDGNASPGDPYLNQTKKALDRWQKPGDISSNPRRLLNGTATGSSGTIYDGGATSPSTRYLYDGDFIRLANVVLSYTLSKRLTETLHVNSLKFFIQGFNLATWTPYSGQDPENIGPSGFGNVLYPQARSYSIGLNIMF